MANNETRRISPADIIRQLVGAILSIASIPVFWRGISALGTVELKSDVVSGSLTTNSAGFALLFSGVFLMVFGTGRVQEAAETQRRSTGDLLIAICFYLFIALSPALGLLGLYVFLKAYHPGGLALLAGLAMYPIFATIALLGTWAVPSIVRMLSPKMSK